ncbi:transcription elongation factor GreA [Mycoplasma sp. SG1]|uniref:transcription elongation factor GreA n=1 Tax=Mycoplasma sp. SG1 TaxID=2810348 RepID=UPI002024A27B|nr:transcription elongation factor GreA [Mycoplasma sp. SG1]URM53140.1 transcription elongation factor GreA [Mycoplasma sp. SG1]
MKKIFVTKDKIESLKKELDYLINTKRKEIIELLKESRAQGDLKENADYDAAKNEQAIVEERIKEIEIILSNNVDIKTSSYIKPNKASIGSVVVFVNVKDIDNKSKHQTVQIVGEIEFDPLSQPIKISYLSPLAQALLNHKIGDTVIVNAENIYKVQIISLS